MPAHAQYSKPPDSEKLTLNLGFVDLGSIDLLVRDGFYSNRSDFIRTAIRNQLATHADAAKKAASRLTLELGLRTFARQDLEALQAAGERLKIRVLGLAVIADDSRPISPGNHRIADVLGAPQAPAAVKAALAVPALSNPKRNKKMKTPRSRRNERGFGAGEKIRSWRGDRAHPQGALR